MYHFIGPTEKEPETTEKAKAESALMNLLSCATWIEGFTLSFKSMFDRGSTPKEKVQDARKYKKFHDRNMNWVKIMRKIANDR